MTAKRKSLYGREAATELRFDRLETYPTMIFACLRTRAAPSDREKPQPFWVNRGLSTDTGHRFLQNSVLECHAFASFVYCE
jgi:hypothetical protein